MKTRLILAAFCAAFPLLSFSEEQLTLLPDQAELFSAENAEEAAKYTELAPLSLTYMWRASEKRYNARNMLIEMVRERIDDPDELRRYLDFIETINENSREKEANWRSNISERLLSGDRLFYFSYSTGDLADPEETRYYSDFGILIIRDGDVVFRKVDGYIGSKENAPDPDRIEFDDL